MSKAPPIPPEQRAFKGQRPDIADDQRLHADQDETNLRERGDQANIAQNTRNQGYQQDR